MSADSKIPRVDFPLGTLRIRSILRLNVRPREQQILGYAVERFGKTNRGKFYWAKVAGFPTKKLAARHIAKIMAAGLLSKRAAA